MVLVSQSVWSLTLSLLTLSDPFSLPRSSACFHVAQNINLVYPQNTEKGDPQITRSRWARLYIPEWSRVPADFQHTKPWSKEFRLGAQVRVVPQRALLRRVPRTVFSASEKDFAEGSQKGSEKVSCGLERKGFTKEFSAGVLRRGGLLEAA